MDTTRLIENLVKQRYQILVAVRPLAPARSAWNHALQALIDTLRARIVVDYDAIEEVQKLLFEEAL